MTGPASSLPRHPSPGLKAKQQSRASCGLWGPTSGCEGPGVGAPPRGVRGWGACCPRAPSPPSICHSPPPSPPPPFAVRASPPPLSPFLPGFPCYRPLTCWFLSPPPPGELVISFDWRKAERARRGAGQQAPTPALLLPLVTLPLPGSGLGFPAPLPSHTVLCSLPPSGGTFPSVAEEVGESCPPPLTQSQWPGWPADPPTRFLNNQVSK